MRAALIVVFVLVVLVGGVFAGQGLGYIPGSFMTGNRTWFWIGLGMVSLGVIIGGGALISGRRNQSRV